jgi:hypothetical protein
MRALVLSMALLTASALPAGVPGSAEAIRPLLVGSEVPAVTLTAADGSELDLSALERSVIVFYRGGW